MTNEKSKSNTDSTTTSTEGASEGGVGTKGLLAELLVANEAENGNGTESSGLAKVSKSSTLLDRVINADEFGVDWVSRDNHGNLALKSTIFTVDVAPPEMFGQSIRNFGFEAAAEAAEISEWEPNHDFGSCYLRNNSLRREADGRWYVDLSVDPRNVRYCKVATRLEMNGAPVLDEDGNQQIEIAVRKETWITCELQMIKPDTAHPYAGEYRQSDARLRGLMAITASSKRLAKTGQKSALGAPKKKTRRARLSPMETARALDRLLGQ